jgi:F0F1-type ATP synthase assembly protein I
MSTEEGQTSQIKAAQGSLQLAFMVLGQVGALTLVAIVGSLIGGLWLDRQLGTRPLFTILLMIGSFPISLYVIYRVALNAVARIPAASKSASPAKEALTRDDNSTA